MEYRTITFKNGKTLRIESYVADKLVKHIKLGDNPLFIHNYVDDEVGLLINIKDISFLN